MLYALNLIYCLYLKVRFYPLVIPKFPFSSCASTIDQPLLTRKDGLLLSML